MRIKRVYFLISILFITFGLLPSISAYTPVRSDSFTLQAGYEESLEVSVQEIPAQSNAYIAGMPFDIEESLVQYGATPDGRRIATIDLLANTPFSLEISGGGMQHIGGEKAAQDLHYILNFDMEIGSYEGETSIGQDEKFSFRSRTGSPMKWTPEIDFTDGTFIGVVNGYIYFMFDQETTNFISTSNDTTLPPGEYGTDVVITITALEESI